MGFRAVIRVGGRAVTRPRVVDAVLVVAACGAVVPLLGAVSGPALTAVVALWVAAALTLSGWRARPVPVTAATVAADLAALPLFLSANVPPPLLAGLPATVALYGLGRYGSRRAAWSMGGAAVAAYFAAALALGHGNQIGVACQVVAAVVVGRLFRLRWRLRERRARQAAQDAVRAERRRIARELHDVVAHHITVINVLVGAGRTTMASDPAGAEEAFLTAERTGRAAMAEMRQLLRVLRADEADKADKADKVGEVGDADGTGPAGALDGRGAGAAQLGALVERAAAAGAPVALEVTGTAVPLPAAVDHAVYRVVQEALTNIRRHAPGARAGVRVAYLPGTVEVEVLDDGTARPEPEAGGGFGLSGMAERVALCGGVLHAGPRPGEGFRVYATIPVPEREEAGGRTGRSG
ncbi:hypothetical protein Misp01_21190 [Microtetraspora sp. NBRC 13810]|uniref:sensor histidine kinase n=1 Tax=Microtetraspora sp. NBRC 13810 TaxID=3030990 RepID=UPI0024A36E9D|nr:histidine kinase [Microtetraspora sp. NBRC 13810]GLW06989.1 hypothetical protein Misp01_21190 [Microtetraspora sp. NBRC 13810]